MQHRRSYRSYASAFLAVVAAIGCYTPAVAEDRRPNVVVLVADDLRADSIGAYGSKQCRTPNLDQLAAEGLVFTRAVCPFPLCVPSRAEILTGCSSLRIPALATGKLDPALVTWPGAMKSGGYKTCYVGKWHTGGRPPQHGYDETRGLYAGGGGHLWKEQTDHNGRPVTGYRGWVFQSQDGKTIEPEHGIGLTPDISRRFADAAISLIREPAGKPFFLDVNFTAPHDPLFMPPGYEKKYDPRQIALPKNFAAEHPFDHGNLKGRDELLLPFPRTKTDVQDELAVYYAVVEHLDEQIGRVIASLKESGQWENTILIFTADHGLAIGSHGLRGKQNMYEHTTCVPLIVCGPGIPAGKRLAAPIYLRDLYPTVCDLAGVPIPRSVEAKSQAAVIRGTAERVHDEVYTYFTKFQRAVRTDRWKLNHYPHLKRDQLFDLVADPDELSDLSADPQHAAVLAELRQKLAGWRRSVSDPALEQSP
ncbi:MAG TPA: sulfatase-like hydrolase/transferase [Pirellulaceae bacterium]|nr:sulfatase-like hydrolase/transferase [Pirellulaceae bacterium]